MGANFYSVGTGLFSDASIWAATPAGAGGAGVPGRNDWAWVQTGTTVTIAADPCCYQLRLVGGSLIINSDITFPNTAWNPGIEFNVTAGSSLTTNATKADPRTFSSEVAGPTYPWKFVIYSTTNARTLDLPFCNFVDNYWIMACHNTPVETIMFNKGAASIMQYASPLTRGRKIDEHFCEGRSYGRIYPRGGNAGIVNCEGLLPIHTFEWLQMSQWKEAADQVSLVTDCQVILKARIEDLRFGKPRGINVPFSLTLVEDH